MKEHIKNVETSLMINKSIIDSLLRQSMDQNDF